MKSSAGSLFEPWKHPQLLARHAPEYPSAPVVDPVQSRRAALDAYAASRAVAR